MKPSGPWLAGVLLISLGAGATSGTEPNPIAVVRALMDAESVANLDGAIALFADDAFIVNVTGWKTADRQELKWFINTEIWLREDFLLDHPQVEGNTVSWAEPVAAAFYKSIGVAPVQFAFEAVVQNGKITSMIAHLPTREIARIREACETQSKDPLIHDRPCSEFVQLIEAHTRDHSSAAKAQESRGR